ncbi:DUF6529 family protein [Nakamurella lactea]|uniref:DUF6529 family protein n=1 Tax=Nakamurella lactea TaxID=459515 RepID=UPI0004170E45|nr:DUF6529 family protein [Nakamurella lactea]
MQTRIRVIDGSAGPRPSRAGRPLAAAAVLLTGAVVAVALGVYARAHHATGRPLATFGFSGTIQMKVWLSSAALVLVLVQLLTALWMWGRLPGRPKAPVWVATLHRWSGSVAFVLTIPVGLQCLWALGAGTGTGRVLLHGLAGCVFYGAYAAKMVGLRSRSLPSWAIAVLGGTVFTLLVVVWLTSAAWFFASDLPLT